MLRTELHEGSEGLTRLQLPWQQLIVKVDNATPFQTFEWQAAWLRTLGRGTPRIVCAYEGSDMVGLYPLVQQRTLWSTLRPMGIGPSDYLQPLARSGYEERVAEAIHYVLSKQKVDLIDLQQLREDQPLAKLMAQDERATRIEQATCLVLDLPDSYDTFLKSLGQSLRYDMRRLDKLLADCSARIEEHGADSVQRGLDILFLLHSARWRRRGLPGALFGKRAAFHRAWAEAAVGQGWLKLTTLQLDGVVVGALYVIHLGRTAYYYQSGVAVRKGGPSPGTLLLAHALRRAIDSGISRFDFLRGDEPYKRRFKPQHEVKNQRFLIAGRGLKGRMASGWNEWAAGIESRIRARLERGG